MEPVNPRHLAQREPTDSDIDLRAGRARRRRRFPARTLAVIAVGGAIGAAARQVITEFWPASPDGFPWSTFAINVTGCALIGILMVLVTDLWARHRLLRPFLGTGVLGGYTTFSTYTLQTGRLLLSGHAATAVGYLFLTVVAALLVVWACVAATRYLVSRRLS